MTRRAHIGGWVVIWFALLVAGPWHAGPDRMAQQVRAEAASMRGAFDPRLAVFLAHGTPTGPAASNATPHGPRHGVLGGAAHAVDALRWQGRGVVLRGSCLLAWWVLLLPVAVAAVVDGFAARAIKADTFGYRNPAAFAVAGHLAIAAVMASAVMLVLPFELPRAWMPLSVLLVLWPLRVTLSHLQPVFAR